MTDKYINLNWEDRIIDSNLLHDSYIHYEDSLNPGAPNYISLEDGAELGIVSSQVPEIAKAISSVLTCSLEDAKDHNGGYLPPKVVERVQTEIISPFGISNVWGTTGHRFVYSRPAHPTKPGKREIIASILVGRSKDTIFFFTGKYNNIKHSEITQTIDLQQSADGNPEHKWAEQFAFPQLEKFKPKFYHQIANFVVAQDYRGQGLARYFLNNIIKYYSRDHIQANGNQIIHSQHLLCGRGFWQIGDPPWLVKMQALGFYLRAGAENFYIEQDWSPLPAIYDGDEIISNIEYNKSFNMPDKYESFLPSPKTDEHLLDRIPEVIRLSKDPRAKLQYFQAMYNFL